MADWIRSRGNPTSLLGAGMSRLPSPRISESYKHRSRRASGGCRAGTGPTPRGSRILRAEISEPLRTRCKLSGYRSCNESANSMCIDKQFNRVKTLLDLDVSPLEPPTSHRVPRSRLVRHVDRSDARSFRSSGGFSSCPDGAVSPAVRAELAEAWRQPPQRLFTARPPKMSRSSQILAG